VIGTLPDEIHTPRLLLRPFRQGDIDDVMVYAVDEEWARYLPVPQPYTRVDAERFLAAETTVDRTRTPSWAIVCNLSPPSVERGLPPAPCGLRRTGQPPRPPAQPPRSLDDTRHDRVIGGINLRLSPEHRLAELGYGLARSAWGRGLATEAVRAVMDTAFVSLPLLNRVRAVADPRNVASLRVMERLGMVREGVLRQNRVLRGELVDEVWCGILRAEWEAQPRAAHRTDA
jgi:[ribosomal protein S5]-alanine N-acetyltransferase